MIMRGLLACYACEVVALAIWIGGLMVIIGAVIPAVFNSLSMEAGGRFLTRVFDGYNRLTTMAIVLLLGAAAFRVWTGSREGLSAAALSRPEIALLTLMIAVAALIILVLGPLSVSLQEQAFVTKEEPARKAAYEAFFRTHTVVRGLYVVNLGLGIALVAVKLRNWISYGRAGA